MKYLLDRNTTKNSKELHAQFSKSAPFKHNSYR